MIENTCIVPKCDMRRFALGFCSKHYTRWQKFGHVHVDRAPPTAKLPEPCDPEVCISVAWRHGWCNTHYRRRLRILKAQARYDEQVALPPVLPLEPICKHCKVNPITHRGPQNYCSPACRQAALPNCSFKGCERKIKHFDLCTGHAMQRALKRELSPLVPQRRRNAALERDEMGRKQCAGCLEWHPVDDYQSHARMIDGLNNYCPECASFSGIKSRYGITPQIYRDMLELQGGVCAICEEPPQEGKRLVVDHDHRCCPTEWKTCGHCIRGLLCTPCNSGIGMLRDDIRILTAGVDYLSQYSLDMAH